MRVFMYFLDLPMYKRLCLVVIEGHLIILLIKAILTRTRLAVVFAFFGSPDFLKSLLLAFRGILYVRFFSTYSYIALTLILNPHDPNEVSSLNYAISFIMRAFSPSVRFFARSILLELIAWATPFLEKRPDFEIT